jgi:hypothetical protein
MKERARQPDGSGGAPAKGLLADYPLLWEMMTADQYDNGKKRKRTTVLLMCDGPVFKILVLDKDKNEQAWAADESMDACLRQVEELLAAGSLSWQQAKEKQPPRNR